MNKCLHKWNIRHQGPWDWKECIKCGYMTPKTRLARGLRGSTKKGKAMRLTNETIVFNTPEGIEFVQLCARRGALKLELVGLKRRGRTAYSICKEVYGLKGTREQVLAQMNELIEQAHRENEARP